MLDMRYRTVNLRFRPSSPLAEKPVSKAQEFPVGIIHK